MLELNLKTKGPITNTVISYFQQHIEDFDEIKKAAYAWHDPDLPFSHLFPAGRGFIASGMSKESFNSTYCRDIKCTKCGRSREEVRYDSLSARCIKTNIDHIKEVLSKESQDFNKLLSRAEKEAPKYIQKLGLSGKTLAYLHSTHGFPPDACVDPIAFKALEEGYKKEIEKERTLSKSNQVKEIVAVKS